MIKYKVGDLITAAQNGEVNVIAHGCNCFNAMGSGIAPLIAAAFPAAKEADQDTEKGSRSKLGTFSYANMWNPRPGPIGLLQIYNLYTQYRYGRRADGKINLNYGAFVSSFQSMLKDLESYDGVAKIGIPKIGAGLGGGDWDIISDLLEAITPKEIDVTVYVIDPLELPVIFSDKQLVTLDTKHFKEKVEECGSLWTVDHLPPNYFNLLKNRTLTVHDTVYIEVV